MRNRMRIGRSRSWRGVMRMRRNTSTVDQSSDGGLVAPAPAPGAWAGEFAGDGVPAADLGGVLEAVLGTGEGSQVDLAGRGEGGPGAGGEGGGEVAEPLQVVEGEGHGGEVDVPEAVPAVVLDALEPGEVEVGTAEALAEPGEEEPGEGGVEEAAAAADGEEGPGEADGGGQEVGGQGVVEPAVAEAAAVVDGAGGRAAGEDAAGAAPGWFAGPGSGTIIQGEILLHGDHHRPAARQARRGPLRSHPPSARGPDHCRPLAPAAVLVSGQAGAGQV